MYIWGNYKEDFYRVKIELEKIDVLSIPIEWRPLNYIELDKDQIKNVEVLASEDLDDVQNIFTNANLKNLL